MEENGIMRRSRAERAAYGGTLILYGAAMAVVLALVVFAFDRVDFFLKKSFLLSQRAALLAGSAGVLLACAVSTRLFAGRGGAHRRLRAAGEGCFWLALFAFQCAVAYFAYFLTDWDVGIIMDSAYNMAAYGAPELVQSSYFSQYPNNILMTEIFAAVIRVFRFFAGDPGLDRCVLVLIFFLCALNTCTGALTRRAALAMTGSRGFSWAAALVYVAFIGVSPWSLIPYSDGLALIIPILVFRLYQRQQESRHKPLLWAGIALLSAAGYLIKPQTFIITIALVLLETVRLLSQGRLRAWLTRVGACLALLAVCVGPVKDWGYAHSLTQPDGKSELGLLHFVMMGLNRETTGTYSGDDFFISLGEKDRQERTRRQMEVIGERLDELGPAGLADLYAQKILVNFADGTFAWGINGTFFAQMIEDKDSVLSPLLKDVLYTYGSRYPAFSTWLQAVWLALLLGCLLAAWPLRGPQALCAQQAVLCLTVFGLTAFECIFEAKARYLYTCAPLFLLMGVWGFWRAGGAALRHVRAKSGSSTTTGR